jgi:hypothetical protein
MISDFLSPLGPPPQAYPCLVIDTAVAFRSRVQMKRLLREDYRDLPWHTPLLAAMAYRVWTDAESPGSLTHALVRHEIEERVNGRDQALMSPQVAGHVQAASHAPEAMYRARARSTRTELDALLTAIASVQVVVAHNLHADLQFLLVEWHRLGQDDSAWEVIRQRHRYCTMVNGMVRAGTVLPGQRPRWPKLLELERAIAAPRTAEVDPVVDDLVGAEVCYRGLLGD